MTRLSRVASGLRRLLPAALLFAAMPQAFPAEEALKFGVLPYQGPRQLLALFTPLRDLLQQTANRRIDIVTAPDIPEFIRRCKQGEYDFILTAPHFGRLAETDSHFQALAITRHKVQAAIVVAKNSPIRTIGALRGKTVAMLPAEAIISMLAGEVLAARHLQPGRDFVLYQQNNAQNVLQSVLHGESDAGAVDLPVLEGFAGRERLRVLAVSGEAPGMVLMAHPRVAAKKMEEVREALLAFSASPQGAAYFAATGHGSWLAVHELGMKSLDPYVSRLRN